MTAKERNRGCIDESGERRNLPATTRKDLDWDLIARMASRMISVTDIAAIVGVSTDTLRRAYRRDFGEPLQDFIAKQRATGRASLSNAQFKRALAGSDKMLTWLGIQHLGQGSRAEISGPDRGPIRTASIDMSKLSDGALAEIVAASDAILRDKTEGDDDG